MCIFSPNALTGEQVAPLPPSCLTIDDGPVSESCHNQRVTEALDSYMARAFALPGTLPIETRIQRALTYATDAREEPGKSTDEVLRDAEYCLHGLNAGASKDMQHAYAIVGSPVYEVMKYVAMQLRGMGYDWLERWLRTNPDVPMSPPGGWRWAYTCLRAGVTIDGKAELGPNQRPNLHLEAPNQPH